MTAASPPRAARMRAPRVAALVLAALLVACKSEPLRDVVSRIPPGVSGAQVQAAIEAGARERRWMLVESTPGHVVARVLVRRRYLAEVDVRYDEREYRISHRYSENLRIGEHRIHQNYVRWISRLDRAIATELLRVAPASPATP